MGTLWHVRRLPRRSRVGAGQAPARPDEDLVVRKLPNMARMRKPFSPTMIAKVVTGSRDKTVMSFQFDRLNSMES